MQSEQLNELAAALAKAQGQMQGAKKDSANPFFKSSYADLASVWDAIRDPLSTNGLSIVQSVNQGDGPITLTTILLHSSGQWIDSRVSVVPVKNDPQGIGSAITYMRRYALSAIVGVAPEDDDGEEAMGRAKGGKSENHESPKEAAKKTPETPKPTTPKPEAPNNGNGSQPGDKLDNEQRIAIYDACRAAGHSDTTYKSLILSLGYKSSADIPVSRFTEILKIAKLPYKSPAA